MIMTDDLQGTSEFFFSVEDHHEWNGSFSVFGTVRESLKLAVVTLSVCTLADCLTGHKSN